MADGRPDQLALGALDIVTRRNAYGRQVDSFEADVHVEPLGIAPFRGVFIRAPQIEAWGGEVRIIATLNDIPVAVEQGPHVGLCFHPEMTGDLRLHHDQARTQRRHDVESRPGSVLAPRRSRKERDVGGARNAIPSKGFRRRTGA